MKESFIKAAIYDPPSKPKSQPKNSGNYMRNLSYIIEECKLNGRPDYEELRYSVLVLISLLNMDHRKLREALLAEKQSPKFIRELEAENSFNAYKTALNKSPKDYLGWSNDPANPEYQKFHTMASKLLDKVMENQKK